MIKYIEGSVFEAGAQTIVNTVNCVGIMGAGLALEFKKRYPDYFADYAAKCKKVQIKTGTMDYFRTRGITIISFPTKNHYRYDSKIEWIEEGLKNFAATYEAQGITSVAFPKLGAGSGNLAWETVKPLMEKHLSSLPIEVTICLNEKTEQISFF